MLALEWVAIIVGLSVLSYYLTKKKKRQTKIYSIINDANAVQIPMQKIMSSLQIDYNSISKDVESMSLNHYDFPLLRDAYIDAGSQCLILATSSIEKVLKKKNKHSFSNNDAKKIIIVTCSHCGAENTKETGSTKNCEYCGSPL